MKSMPIKISEYRTKLPSEKSSRVGGLTKHEVDESLSKLSINEKDRIFLNESLGDMLKISELKDGLAITSSSFVGIANFSEFSVIVEPKILMKRENLFGMVNFTFGLDDWKHFPDEFSPETNENYLIDIIIHTFTKQCEVLVKQGLYKSYVTHQDDLSYLRGKLLLKQQLKNFLQNKPKFACEYDELEYDNLENQILLFCLNRSYNITKHAGLRKQIRMLIFQLSSVVSDKYITKNDFKKLHYTRQNSHYLQAHELSKLIIESSGIVDFYSDRIHRVESFFVDMNKIFEKFVFRLFDVYLKSEYKAIPQKGEMIWQVEGGARRGIRPDILLKNRHSSEVIVADTKYKDKLDDSDLYQIGFYIHQYSENKDEHKTGFAIVPTTKELESERKYQRIFSEEQKITIIRSFLNIDEIVDLLYKKDSKSSEELSKLVKELVVIP